MAKKEITWTLKAIQDKLDILEYWIERNNTKTYSEKLDKLFDKSIEYVSNYPEHRKKTNYKDIRIEIVRHYLLYYLILEQDVKIVRI